MPREAPRTRTSLCLIARRSEDGRREMLFGRKKLGFGKGKLAAVGGHVELGETPAQAAAREVGEEVALFVDPSALEEVAALTLRFPSRPEWDQQVTVFLAETWSGLPRESEELAPSWFPAEDLPLEEMWDDARHWLPRVVASERLVAEFTYAEDERTLLAASVVPVSGGDPDGR